MKKENTMPSSPISQLPLVEENEASGQAAELFDSIKQVMEIPFVPNIHRAVAAAPNALAGTWDVLRNVFLQTSLPMSLASMIMFSISAAKNCQYCSAVHQVTCKTLGVEEDTLTALQDDLSAVAPERVQSIVVFAQKCALDPQGLTEGDYDAVRRQGVSDEEIIEVISLAALANYLDTLADALKVPIDSAFRDALGG
jgi:uncharacterized peroxidase-related enzyme